jgi:hypothetical protein
MLRHRTTAFVCVCLAVVAAGRNEGSKPAAPGSASPVQERADTRVRALADACLEGFFQRNPDQMTLFGSPDAITRRSPTTGSTRSAVSFLHQKIRAWAAK